MSSNRDATDNITVIFNVDSDLKISLIHSGHLKDEQSYKNISKKNLIKLINELGDESAKAQHLQVPITTTEKFTTKHFKDLIYVIFGDHSSDSKFLNDIGFIRFGKRDLYFDDGNSLKHIKNCPCILDFYIRFKRRGYGKILFDSVIANLNLKPGLLAYDRPSLSMLSFLKRHYSLNTPLWQHNHFVIFPDIFSS